MKDTSVLYRAMVNGASGRHWIVVKVQKSATKDEVLKAIYNVIAVTDKLLSTPEKTDIEFIRGVINLERNNIIYYRVNGNEQ